jgi:hypothetical protein
MPIDKAGGTTVADDPEIDDLPSAAPTGYRIEKIYLYRTNSGSAGTAAYQFVLEADWFSASTAYAVGDFTIYGGSLYKCTTTHSAGAWNAGHFTAGDDVADSALGETLTSTTYAVPSSSLTGLVSLPYGSLAGFVDNEVYFSEPYLPHAWPASYRVPVDYDIVGLGVYGNTLVVLTEGFPYLLQGSSPDTITPLRLSDYQPCVAKRSIVSAQNGVFYASHEGLIRIDANGVTNTTQEYVTPEEWEDYYPSTMNSQFYSGKYFGWSSSFDGCVIIDFINNLLTELNVYSQAGYVSFSTGNYYLVMDDADYSSSTTPQCIKLWEGDDYNYLYYKWKSKKFITPEATNFSVARVLIDSEFYDDIIALIESESYILNLNATTYDDATASVTGDSDHFTGSAGDKLKLTINATDYDDIDVSSCTDIGDVVTAINTAVSTQNPASEDASGYLFLTGRIGQFYLELADGTNATQTCIASLISGAASRSDTITELEGSLNMNSLNSYSLNANLLQASNECAINQYVAFKEYADGDLKHTKIVTSENLFRLPAGFRAKKWEFQIEGNIPVRRVEMATSAGELFRE